MNIQLSLLWPVQTYCISIFGVTLFAKHQRLKILAVLDLKSCISNFSIFLASSRVSWLQESLINMKGFTINVSLVQ